MRTKIVSLFLLLLFLGAQLLAQVHCSYTVNPPAGCPPMIVSIIDNSTGNPTWWNWGSGMETNSSVQLTFSNPGVYNTSYIVGNSSSSDTCYPQIKVFQPPIDSFTSFDNEGCAGPCHTVNFINLSIPGDAPIVQYVWDFGIPGWPIDSAGNIIFTYCDTGNYYVALIMLDSNGCQVNSVNQIMIEAKPQPIASISANGDTLIAYGTYNFQWFLDTTPISGATSSVYAASTPGSYTVEVTDSNGCSALSSPVVIAGIENINASENISVYPNPTNSNWQLSVGNNLIGAPVEILDDNGRVVYKTEIKNLHSEIPAQLADGIYILRIASCTSIISRKLVKL